MAVAGPSTSSPGGVAREDVYFVGDVTVSIDGLPFVVQHFGCNSRQFKNFPRCRPCISREGLGDTCRFKTLRAVPVSPAGSKQTPNKRAGKGSKSPASDEAVATFTWPPREEGRSADAVFLTSPVANEEAFLPQHHNLNRAMPESARAMILGAVARSILPVLTEARQIAKLPRCIRKQRELQYRSLCDSCNTGLFASSYMCMICGQEYCTSCRNAIVQQGCRAIGEQGSKTLTASKKPDHLSYCTGARHRMGNLHLRHVEDDLIPATRFSLSELDMEIEAMEQAIAEMQSDEGRETSVEAQIDDKKGKVDNESGRDEVVFIDSSMSHSADALFEAGFKAEILSDNVEDKDRFKESVNVWAEHEPYRTIADVWRPSIVEVRDSSGPNVTISHQSVGEESKSGAFQQAEGAEAGLEAADIKICANIEDNARPLMSPNGVLSSDHASASSLQGHESNSVLGTTSTSSDSESFSAGTISPPPSEGDRGMMLPGEGPPPSHILARHDADAMTEEMFLKTWAHGEPLVVDNVEAPQTWDPAAFQKRYGDELCEIVRCDRQPPTVTSTRQRLPDDPTWSKMVKVREFFATFGTDEETRSKMLGKGIWKLKDWPPSAEFRSSFPDIYDDFNAAVPMPDYTRRDGCKNLSALFPLNANGPDLGPKMYNAWPGQHTKGKKGTTRLHMDIADAVNIMLYASETGEAVGAQWDIFRAQDAQKIREFLWELEGTPNRDSDPIHVQIYYLDDDLLDRLYKEKGVYSWRIIQKPGQAVFIPAGCAHQVCNLSDCIKVAVDFLSIQNIERCFRLTEEFAALMTDKHKSWKEDVLQLRAQLWYAWKTCQGIGPPLSDDIMEQRRAVEKQANEEQSKRQEERKAPRKPKRQSEPYTLDEGDAAEGVLPGDAFTYRPASSTRSGRAVKAPATRVTNASDSRIKARIEPRMGKDVKSDKTTSLSQADERNVLSEDDIEDGLSYDSLFATSADGPLRKSNICETVTVSDSDSEVEFRIARTSPAKRRRSVSLHDKEEDRDDIQSPAQRRRAASTRKPSRARLVIENDDESESDTYAG